MAPEIISRAEARAQGLKRYFTGAPCKRGHVVERQVASLTCMECDSARRRACYDPEKNRESGKRWRAANREKVAAASAAYSKTPQAKAYQAAWFQANKIRVMEQRKANPNSRPSCIASAKRWADANPDKAREHSRLNRRNRRARAKQSGGTHTEADLVAILGAQGGRCAYCKVSLNKVRKHVDHIMPLARGGSNGRENLQYLCQTCNQTKGARDPVAFAQSMGLLL